MRRVLVLAAAAVSFGSAALVGSAATAQAPIRTRVYGPPPVLDAEEVRDYRIEQMERRQEIQRERLRFNQRVERRLVDPDEDDDD